MLKAMRRQGDAVFVASPPEDVIDACKDLRNELRAMARLNWEFGSLG
jgi:hypothetical protein